MPTKKPKDVNAPKRAPSAYLIFSNDSRARVSEANPHLTMTGVTKFIATEWKGMDADDKMEYQDRAKSLKAQYAAALVEYKKSSQYKEYQLKLQKWKDEQRQTSPNQSKIGKKKVMNANRDQSSMDSQQIRKKIDSFFDKYRMKLRQAPYPKQYVSNAYGDGIEKAGKWVTEELVKKQKEFTGALVAFRKMVMLKANIEMMDARGGGLHMKFRWLWIRLTISSKWIHSKIK